MSRCLPSPRCSNLFILLLRRITLLYVFACLDSSYLTVHAPFRPPLLSLHPEVLRPPPLALCVIPKMGYSIFKQNDVRYHPLAESEDKIAICRNPTESDVNSGSRNSRSTPSRFFLAPIAILLITSITLTFILLESTMAKNGCPNPRVRREWRMLERSERLEYLRAVQCLTQTQSSRDPRVSKQDDFTFLHSQYGSYCT